MKPDLLFEQAWTDLARGTSLEEVRHLPSLSPEVLAELRVAAALRDLGERVDVVDLDAEWAALESALRPRPEVAPVRKLRPRFPVLRYAAAVAAVIVGLAVVSLQAAPGSPLYRLRRGIEEAALVLSPSDGGLHANLAAARLDDLVRVLSDGPADQAPAMARALVHERSAARAARVDVSPLDRAIAERVPQALALAPQGIAAEVRTILGSLLEVGSDDSGQGTSGSGGSNGGGGSQGGAVEGSGGGSGTGSTATGGDSSEHGSGSTGTGASDEGSTGADSGPSDGSTDSQGSPDQQSSGDSQTSDTSGSSPSPSDQPDQPDPSASPFPDA